MSLITEHITRIKKTISEMGPDYTGKKPLNYKTNNKGEYTFDIPFTDEFNEQHLISMKCIILTVCDMKYLTVEFNEIGSKQGETTGSGNKKTMSDKMEAVMYCIDYHIQESPCQIDKIGFQPAADDEKDSEQNNRRANIYIYYAKKYLPIIGSKYIGTETIPGMGVVMNIEPVEGHEDGIMDLDTSEIMDIAGKDHTDDDGIIR